MTNEYDVIIIGGGPVGLSSALLLARYGIRSVVVEKDSGPTTAPKARLVNTRTMEIFRQLGLEEEIVRGSHPLDSWRFLFCDELAGKEWARFEDPVDEHADMSPTWRCIVMQSHVEAVLAQAVENTPQTKILFNTTLIELSHDHHGVSATLKDEQRGHHYEIRGAYLIGADGTQSRVRQALGIDLAGESGLAWMATIHHRTDLSPWLADRPCTMALTVKPGVLMASTGIAGGLHEWVTMVALSEQTGFRLDDFTPDHCKEIVRTVVGMPELEVEVLHVGSFTINFQLAEQFRHGRVLLAGDAAHRIPPAGGFGMNLGIQSAHNLCWKLAASIGGTSRGDLLETYDTERRAVAMHVGKWCKQNTTRIGALVMARFNDDFEEMQSAATDMEKYIRNIGMDLGMVYPRGTVAGDARPEQPVNPSEYLPSIVPGSRAPHCWLVRNGKRLSSLDLFGDGFVLLSDDEDNGWQTAVTEMSREFEQVFPMGLCAYRIGKQGDLVDAEGNFTKLYSLPRGGALLIRPDGYVAWSSTEGEAPSTAKLRAVLQELLR